jgi:hypothetical protein
MNLRILAKPIWEKFEIQLGTSWWRTWELDGNTLRTRKKTQKNSRPKRKKKLEPSWVHAEASHWVHKTFISKTVCHHFWPVLNVRATNCSACLCVSFFLWWSWLVGFSIHLSFPLSYYCLFCFVLFLKLKSLNGLIVVVVVLELISRMSFAAKFCCEIFLNFFLGVCFCLSSE